MNNMEKESNQELLPILEGSPEKQSEPEEHRKHTFGTVMKGIICAFLWPFFMAVSMICVQALENRSVMHV